VEGLLQQQDASYAMQVGPWRRSAGHRTATASSRMIAKTMFGDLPPSLARVLSGRTSQPAIDAAPVALPTVKATLATLGG